MLFRSILEITGLDYKENKKVKSEYIRKQKEKEKLIERFNKLFKSILRLKWELDDVIIPIDYYKSDLQANLVKLKADLEVYLDVLQEVDEYEIEIHKKNIEYIERKMKNAGKH